LKRKCQGKDVDIREMNEVVDGGDYINNNLVQGSRSAEHKANRF
jgi:hypothetical protein